MRRIATAFALFYLFATVAVSADRTANIVDKFDQPKMEVRVDDKHSSHFDAYPHFREALRKRWDICVTFSAAVPVAPLVHVCRYAPEVEVQVFETLLYRETSDRAPPLV